MTSRQATDEGYDLLVGIDAGGSSTRARAVTQGALVFEGVGGPGNPLMAGAGVVRASYEAALEGCPAASRVAACVSGGSGEAQRAQIATLLAGRFPTAAIHVAPDYVAAFLAAPPGTNICIVAGTGSVVCSQATDGSFLVSGGQGWILGDHGGAARLGRAALEHLATTAPDVPTSLAAGVRDLLGDDDLRAVVRTVHTSSNPAPLLAQAAPLLTTAAEDGEGWAAEQLAQEMNALASTAARHIDQYLDETDPVRVALSGGVWQSSAAERAFTASLQHAAGRSVAVLRLPTDPLDGAIRLAETFT